MAQLTEQQKKDYWQFNLRLTILLLAIWFVVTYLISGLWAGTLNQFTFLGFPFGYYMAAQGSLIIYVAIIGYYAIAMRKADLEHGVHEGEED